MAADVALPGLLRGAATAGPDRSAPGPTGPDETLSGRPALEQVKGLARAVTSVRGPAKSPAHHR